MSKQDIEKRLGFAAQGVKETTRTSAKAAFDLTGNELDNRIAPTMHSLGHFVEVKVPQLKQNIADAAKYAKTAYDSGKRIMQSATASPQEIREFERQVSVAKAQPGWRIANSENFSRPGAKAKFELRAQKIMGDGRVYLDLKKAKEWLSSENNKALEQIISSAKANSDKESRGGVDGPKFNYYADLAMMAQEILKSNKREGRMQASLPGAKAKA